jgi:hypothetical protein
MWLLSLESVASLAWVCLLAATLIIAAVQLWLLGRTSACPELARVGDRDRGHRRGAATPASAISTSTLTHHISVSNRSRSLLPTAATVRTATRGIPDDLLGWLTQRYDAVFTQDENARPQPGAPQPLGRIQVTRGLTGGELHDQLLSGKQYSARPAPGGVYARGRCAG